MSRPLQHTLDVAQPGGPWTNNDDVRWGLALRDSRRPLCALSDRSLGGIFTLTRSKLFVREPD